MHLEHWFQIIMKDLVSLLLGQYLGKPISCDVCDTIERDFGDCLALSSVEKGTS